MKENFTLRHESLCLKTLIITAILSLTSIVSVSAADFGLKIAGIQVTSDNAASIQDEGITGKVTYD